MALDRGAAITVVGVLALMGVVGGLAYQAQKGRTPRRAHNHAHATTDQGLGGHNHVVSLGKHTDARPGEQGGKKYDEARHYVTLVVDVSSKRREDRLGHLSRQPAVGSGPGDRPPALASCGDGVVLPAGRCHARPRGPPMTDLSRTPTP